MGASLVEIVASFLQQGSANDSIAALIFCGRDVERWVDHHEFPPFYSQEERQVPALRQERPPAGQPILVVIHHIHDDGRAAPYHQQHFARDLATLEDRGELAQNYSTGKRSAGRCAAIILQHQGKQHISRRRVELAGRAPSLAAHQQVLLQLSGEKPHMPT